MKQQSNKDCDAFDGQGEVLELSCCGDNMENNDIDRCPTCMANWCSDMEDCEECDGTGRVTNN